MNQAGFQTLMAQPRRWDVIAGFMAAQNYKTFVEVGAKEGRTTGHVLKTIPDSHVIAIDPWAPMPQQKDVKGGETYEEWDFAKIEAEFWENVGENKDRCTMLRLTSENAVDRFNTESDAERTIIYLSENGLNSADCIVLPVIDCVFIDAAHDYENVKLDIERWWPLIRDGGCLFGHDWNHRWPGVERAVARSFNLIDVGVAPDSVWFVLKSDAIRPRFA